MLDWCSKCYFSSSCCVINELVRVIEYISCRQMTSNKTQPQQLVTDTWHLLSGHRGRKKLEDWSYLEGKFSDMILTRTLQFVLHIRISSMTVLCSTHTLTLSAWHSASATWLTLYQRSSFTSSPVSTGMGDRLQSGTLSNYHSRIQNIHVRNCGIYLQCRWWLMFIGIVQNCSAYSDATISNHAK